MFNTVRASIVYYYYYYMRDIFLSECVMFYISVMIM